MTKFVHGKCVMETCRELFLKQTAEVQKSRSEESLWWLNLTLRELDLTE